MHEYCSSLSLCVCLEVPAAAVGHGAARGSDPQHRRHRSGPLAVPGPPAERRLGGKLLITNSACCVVLLSRNMQRHFLHSYKHVCYL